MQRPCLLQMATVNIRPIVSCSEPSSGLSPAQFNTLFGSIQLCTFYGQSHCSRWSTRNVSVASRQKSPSNNLVVVETLSLAKKVRLRRSTIQNCQGRQRMEMNLTISKRIPVMQTIMFMISRTEIAQKIAMRSTEPPRMNLRELCKKLRMKICLGWALEQSSWIKFPNQKVH